MILNKIGYSYNDLTIIPTITTSVSSRSQIDPFDYNGMLPIFTAPMSTVVNIDNFNIWNKNKIYPIIPRNISSEIRKYNIQQGNWVAISLKEAVDWFINNEIQLYNSAYICIDIANGHMEHLINTCSDIKEKYGRQITIMTGNIANPETLYEYENTGIDYVRCSIGSGFGCITSSNTGIHYPIASLIQDCANFKRNKKFNIKIIADGGIRNYSDVIKAIALGADYVMIGGLFAGMKESAAPITESGNKIFYGMASKEGQIAINGEKTKTSEGICKEIPITTSVENWSNNMIAYLKSAMSYCNSYALDDFRNNVCLIPNSNSEINSVNK